MRYQHHINSTHLNSCPGGDNTQCQHSWFDQPSRYRRSWGWICLYSCIWGVIASSTIANSPSVIIRGSECVRGPYKQHRSPEPTDSIHTPVLPHVYQDRTDNFHHNLERSISRIRRYRILQDARSSNNLSLRVFGRRASGLVSNHQVSCTCSASNTIYCGQILWDSGGDGSLEESGGWICEERWSK